MAQNTWAAQLIANKAKATAPPTATRPVGIPIKPVAVSPDKGPGPGIPTQAPTPPPVTAKPKPAPTKVKPKPKPKPKAKPKSALDKWLAGDTTYQQQQSGFNKEWTDYVAQFNRQSQILNRDYSTTQRQMNKQAVDDRTQQANDFAGRGILHSGVYAKSLGDYNTDFNTKLANLLQGKTDTSGDLNTDKNNFKRQLDLDRQAAKQDAIRRRSQRLGL